MKFQKRSIFHVFAALVIITCFALSSCDGAGSSGDMTGYTECYYDIASSTNISSIRVLYPCNVQTSGKTYDIVTLSGGMTNTKEDMYWLGTQIAESGYIVFALSAASNMSVSAYASAQEATYNIIVAENKKSTSPIFGKVRKIGLMGYSMGGGAVLNIGHKLGSKVAVVIGMAPYQPSTTLSGMTAKTLLVVGDSDGTASPSGNAEPAYTNLPNITKMLAEMSSFGHLEWVNNTSTEGDFPANLIISWLDYSLNGDQTALQNLNNLPSKFTKVWKNLVQ